MLDHELRGELRALQESPEDLPRWVRLIRSLRRLRLDPRDLPLGGALPGLVRAWRARETRTGAARVLAELYGVQVLRRTREYPGHYTLHGRAVEDPDLTWDRPTGLPLCLRRTRDRSVMHLVAPGRTWVGAPGAAAREVEVAPFYLDVEPVSCGHFTRWLRYSPGNAAGPWRSWAHVRFELRVNEPATAVTWDEARAYAAWVGGRLPTEVEWEAAAGAGLLEDYARGERSRVEARAVASPASPFGIRGLLQAPGEWCAGEEPEARERPVRGWATEDRRTSWRPPPLAPTRARHGEVLPWTRHLVDAGTRDGEIGLRVAMSF